MANKYSTEGLIEAEYEPRGKVLKNKLGIRIKKKIEKIEAEAFSKIQANYWRIFSEDSTPEITADLIKEIHRMWLSPIYDWAGEYRKVKISKGDCIFCFPLHIPSQMKKLEKTLKKYTPLKKGCDLKTLAESIARVHGEFEIIHPFREGNGRVGRLIADLMALQAGYPPLNFERLKTRYLHAMEKICLEDDFGPLNEVIKKAIATGIRRAREASS